jgi:ribose transport system permease protein
MSATPTVSEGPAVAGFLTRFRARYVPNHIFGELLAKPWIDTFIPTIVLLLVLSLFAAAIPDFFSLGSLGILARVLGEYILLAIGQTIVMIGGGIDLSVGSVFGLCNFVALALLYQANLHVLVALPLTVLVGAAIGSVNGFLVGYLRLRAFLTTLVTLIIVRAGVNLWGMKESGGLVSGADVNGSDIFDFLGDGSVLGVPSSLIVAALVAICAHIFLSRTRLGWHIFAVGGSRRAAFNAGIRVRRTVFFTYAISGALTGLAGVFYATRLNSAALSAGVGTELTVIAGVVLGGISLGGGRGSLAKAILGTTAIVCINNGMLRMDLAVGGSSVAMGLILLIAVVFDIRWNKNRHKLLSRSYVSPIWVQMPPRPSIDAGFGSPYARNERLRGARPLGIGLDGPEDMVIDDEGNLFTGTRTGNVVKFFGPDFTRSEVFAYTGGRPLGLQVDKDGSIVVCVAGMGLYRLTKDGQVVALSVQTNRSFSVLDDSRVRYADDLDIAPDRKIYYSDPTKRYEASEWLTDALEGRGNGRLICYDPADRSSRTVMTNLVFANGVCVMWDAQSVLVAETWAARISRLWIAGPKAGKSEIFIADLPGYPDNINRSSDGHYWVALVGMRSPAFDLSLSLPDFRKRMVRRVAPDNWLMPNMFTGSLIKFDANARILDTLWDAPDGSHPQITSVREHKGQLFIGGVHNDRIGVLELEGADPNWTGYDAYWGEQS